MLFNGRLIGTALEAPSIVYYRSPSAPAQKPNGLAGGKENIEKKKPSFILGAALDQSSL